jgi:gliding motility-associated-like protein
MKKYILLVIFTCFGFLQANSQCWKILESGANHTVAIHQDGTLWAWGANFNGEVGDGTTNNSNIPILISSDTTWVAISAGHSHNLAIKSNGTLWSWGYDVHHALGLGSVTQVNVPTQVGSATNWVYVSAGHSFSFAIKSNGTLWGWGLNINGEIGDGTITPKTTPAQVGTQTDWAKVFTGNNYTAAIKTNKTLWTWGSYNNFGELGYGNYSSSFVPNQVGTGSNWLSVSTESSFGLGLKTDGTIWGWGDNNFGQLGLGTGTSFLSPTQIGTDTDWKKVETGNYKSFFIKNNGTLWGTGNSFLGNGTTTNSNFLIQIGTGVNWSTVSSQLFQTIGLQTTNIGYGWGSNYFGQIGNGYTDNGFITDPNDYSLPVQINCPCTAQVIPTFSLPSNLCTGSSAPLLPTTSNNGIVGTWSPSIISESSSGTYVFTPNVLLFPCASLFTLSITVSAIVTPTFNSIPTTYCQYEIPPTLPTNSTNTIPLVGVWNPNTINTNVVGTSTYTFIPNAGQCVSSTPFELVITINPSVISDFAPIMPLCVGDSAPILLNTAPNGVVGTWSPNVVSNTTTGSYEFTPSGTGCVAKQLLQIIVLPATIPDFLDLTLCKGDTSVILENVSPNGILGTWSPSVINAFADGNYLFTPNSFQCATNQTISVSVQESLIESVDYTISNNFSENPTLSIIVLPSGNYMYQLDNGAFQQNSIFENVTPGQHSVSILDSDGCSDIKKIEGIRIINYPNYFTPNNDGYHDYWNITGMDNSFKAKIFIFDRFGKLLKQFNQPNVGWDGTYNGRLMPATDYWFKIEYIENNISKQFTSHFSLVR